MKITVEFNNLDEVNEFLSGVYIAPGLAGVAREEQQTAAEPVKETKAKKSTPKKEKAQEEPQTNAEEASTVTETAEEASTEAEGAATETEAPAAASEHSDKDLKLLLSDKLKAGKKKEVKALFEKYGVGCLTDLIAKEKDNIDAVYAEAEVL